MSGLRFQGVVLTMFDQRNSLSGAGCPGCQKGVLGDKVYQTVIPRNVRVS